MNVFSRYWKEEYGLGVFALLFCIPLLLPGYILTLDMVFAPHILPPIAMIDVYRNGWVIRWLLHVLSLIFSGWLVQKLLLLTLFLSLPFLASRFLLPSVSSKTRSFLAAFFLFTPFVYTRFLAGHWTHLFAYALFPLVWHESLRLFVRGVGEWKRGVGFGLLLALVFAFSLHLGVMALFLAAGGFIVTWPERSSFFARSLLIASATFLLATSYWTIPAFLHRDASILTGFTATHLEAFRPAADPYLGTIGNLLALYGFWGEREPWAQQFIWVKAWPWLCGISGAVLAALIVSGFVLAVRTPERRREACVLLVLGILALIFASGVAQTPFLSINQWLFAHIGFWRGFRDSQKWIAVLAFVYVFFAGITMERIQQLSSRVWRWILTIVSFAAVFVYSFPMLGGFWGQVKPVWYPASWEQANAILREDPACKAVFLPWHAYFSLKFNHDLLTLSPARDFFSCEIVQSREVELGGIENQGPPDPAYDALEGVITGKDGYSPAQSIELLRAQGIHFVIFAKDIQGSDPWTYSFLDVAGVYKSEFEGLTLYRLVQ